MNFLNIFYYPVLSQKNGGGPTYLIILEMVLTPNLHLERLIASLVLRQTFLRCTATAFSLVNFGLSIFLVPFPLLSINYLRNVLACRKTYRNDVTDFNSEFFMKPGNQSMAQKSCICIKDFTANLKTELIVVHASIANSCKNQCKHYTFDPTCVTNKNMSHSEIKQWNQGKRQRNIMLCTLLNLLLNSLSKRRLYIYSIIDMKILR